MAAGLSPEAERLGFIIEVKQSEQEGTTPNSHRAKKKTKNHKGKCSRWFQQLKLKGLSLTAGS